MFKLLKCTLFLLIFLNHSLFSTILSSCVTHVEVYNMQYLCGKFYVFLSMDLEI